MTESNLSIAMVTYRQPMVAYPKLPTCCVLEAGPGLRVEVPSG